MWYERDTQTKDIPSDDAVQTVIGDIVGPKRCYNCKLEDQRKLRQQVMPTPNGFTYLGQQYHTNDTVYIKKSAYADQSVYTIGQVIRIRRGKDRKFDVRVRVLDRHDDMLRRTCSKSLLEQVHTLSKSETCHTSNVDDSVAGAVFRTSDSSRRGLPF